ncbi:hypothetical protein PENTCL1PPCAC_28868, partial [Pristionchus entomophagus]
FQSESPFIMHITVCDLDRIVNVDLTDDCPIENLLALVMADLENDSHDASLVQLLKNGVDVLGTERSKTLMECGLSDGDLLLYSYATASSSSSFAAPVAVANSLAGPSSVAPSSLGDGLDDKRKRLAQLLGQGMQELAKKLKPAKTPEEEEDEKCRKLFEQMSRPDVKSNVYSTRKELLEQYLKNPTDYDGFKREFQAFMAEEKRKIEAIQNPFSAEGQALVLERIRLENCNKMYEEAMEKMPEAFVQVHMLYVKIVVNGAPTFAFIDSGAQISFMALSFVQQANLEHKIDKRFQGIVSGIGGTDRMVGRIYSCEFEIGDAKFDAKVDVMNDKFDVLIGLDFMRRHRCCIDLARNRLSFNENTYAEFLSDAEIKEWQNERDHLRDSKFKVDEDKLAQLLGMGFTQKDSEEALRNSANDVPDAVRALFAQAQKDADDIANAGEDGQKMEQ